MKILLGITGSIAGYKALELIRLLRKQGGEVRVILTEAGRQFVTPLSCQTLSDNEVYKKQFVLTEGIKHLTLRDWSDMLVVAPATANFIGKAACGIGDDLLTTTMISYRKPVLVVPAMDEGMWDNPIVKKNTLTLKAHGVHFLEPSVGLLASGKVGRGRFPAVDMIRKKIMTILEQQHSLAGVKFLVTGGRTEEDLDPVRVVTNRSTGSMGSELLQAIYCRGGEVKGIFGEVTCTLPQDIDIHRVRTSGEMLETLTKMFNWCDYLIMAAAVGDYRPRNRHTAKVHDTKYRLDLEKTRDLLKAVAAKKGKRKLVGFSLEDKEGLARAKVKMKAKNLDMVVLNTSAAIGHERIKAGILRKKGKHISLKEMTKWQLANRILDECVVGSKQDK
ncbi:MAG: bifunctional phosphopantothenoylcysteine decarboxylase/phosphopantothenate--cysteine ligase CoaBC [candidate division WOR-3 bacterium]|jgi:phosphopantothenoylcysteine decarboxylase/phosphopantothenate--cysteine ligase